MDVRQSVRALRRQWILTAGLLLLTLAATVALALRPGPYQAASQVVLLPSKTASKASGNNPYLSFGQSLTLTADVVRRLVMDPRTALELAGRGATGSYVVADDPTTAGPVLDVTVVAKSTSTTERTLQVVTSQIAVQLSKLQAGISPANKITSLVISYDPKAAPYTSKKLRPLVVVLGLGLVLTIAIPLAVDTAVLRRRARRQTMRRRTDLDSDLLVGTSPPGRRLAPERRGAPSRR
jgi:hypothetical protein